MRTCHNKHRFQVLLTIAALAATFGLDVSRMAIGQAPNQAIRQPAPNNTGRYTNAPAAQPQQQLPAQPQQQVPAQPQQQLSSDQLMKQMQQSAVLAPNIEQPPAILAPSFFPLPPEKDRMLKELLGKWQKATEGIERYKCEFVRWQFDMTKISDPKVFHTAAKGVVRYLAPDKGMFRVDELKIVRKDPRDPKSEWKFHEDPNQFGEYWICDGNSVHLYDRTQKKATKYQLPPEMQGKQVFNSPLPFFFGVDAQKIEQRFWVNPLPDGAFNNQTIHVLEVYPKTLADAVNYHHVTVYLDKKESLPVAIEVCMPNWTEKTPNREFFEFRDRVTNWSLLDKLKGLNIFADEFIPKDPPADWTVEVKPYEPEDAPAPPPQADPARVANPGYQPVR